MTGLFESPQTEPQPEASFRQDRREGAALCRLLSFRLLGTLRTVIISHAVPVGEQRFQHGR
jgi:hypothetical protein